MLNKRKLSKYYTKYLQNIIQMQSSVIIEKNN